MKKTIFIFLAALAIISCKQREGKAAGELPQEQLVDSTTFTTIEWIDSSFKELGTVKEGPEVEVSYRFKNTGDKPLVISNVTASCGCTIPEKPTEPFAPGQEGSIKAKFKTEGHVGSNEKVITIYSNTKNTPVQEMKFHIQVEKNS